MLHFSVKLPRSRWTKVHMNKFRQCYFEHVVGGWPFSASVSRPLGGVNGGLTGLKEWVTELHNWGGETTRITAGGGEKKKGEIIQSWERLERAFKVKGRELDTQHAGRMERVREQRPFCSLSKSQRDREIYCERDVDQEPRYTASSADREEGTCRVPTQKSYSSSETLQAFDHDPSRMLFGGRVKEMVHKESAEYSRPGEGAHDILGFFKVNTHTHTASSFPCLSGSQNKF